MLSEVSITLNLLIAIGKLIHVSFMFVSFVFQIAKTDFWKMNPLKKWVKPLIWAGEGFDWLWTDLRLPNEL